MARIRFGPPVRGPLRLLFVSLACLSPSSLRIIYRNVRNDHFSPLIDPSLLSASLSPVFLHSSLLLLFTAVCARSTELTGVRSMCWAYRRRIGVNDNGSLPPGLRLTSPAG